MPPRRQDRPETITLNIPSSTMARVRIMLVDAHTGRIRYGAMARLINSLLIQWLNSLDRNTKNGH